MLISCILMLIGGDYKVPDVMMDRALTVMVESTSPEGAFTVWTLVGRHWANKHSGRFPLLPLAMQAEIEEKRLVYAALTGRPPEAEVARLRRLEREAARLGVTVKPHPLPDWAAAQEGLLALKSALFDAAFDKVAGGRIKWEEILFVQAEYGLFHSAAMPKSGHMGEWRKRMKVFLH